MRGRELDDGHLESICIRLHIDAEAHIDLNIYAIPDAQMALVEKRAMVRFGKAFDSQFALDAQTAREIRLDPDQIYVAHRRKGWEKSDPLELEEWFLDAVDRHAPWTDLRRIVRYLKAWRDQRWDACGLSSLTLMVCAIEALDEANTPPLKNRDDDGLLVVARALAHKLAGAIFNPVVNGRRLNDEWTVNDRNSFELSARLLRDEMETALEKELSAGGVVVRLRKLFGPRIPDDVTLVSALPTISQIRSTPAKEAPSPKVGSSTSG